MGAVGLLTAVFVLLLVVLIRWNRWRQQRLIATIAVVTLPDFPSTYLQNQRQVQVFLPPGYADSGLHYPVLYLNDGQDVGQLGLRETLARLISQGRIAPLIVVAISTNAERLAEYGTAVSANAQGLGGKAGLYSQFVTQELLPTINNAFRTKTGVGETAVLGASLGGLSAFDLAWNHPDIFGIVGVFSGSFWWRAPVRSLEEAPEEVPALPGERAMDDGPDNASGREDPPVVTPGRRIAHNLVRCGTYRPQQRFWFQAATQDETADRDNNGVIDAIQDTLELIDELVRLGYRRGQNVVYVEVLGGRHNYSTWAEVLPKFLTWTFPG